MKASMESLSFHKEKNILQNGTDITRKAFLYISVFCSVVFVFLFKLRLESFYYHFDDAFITYTFARNLSDGYGIVFHPEFTPIQGSSSLLHTILLAILSRITSTEVHIVGGLFSLFSYIGFLAATLALIEHCAPNISNKTKIMILVASYFFQIPLLFSYGLETTFVNTLLILSLYFIVRKDTRLAMFFLALIPIARLDYLLYFPAFFTVSCVSYMDCKRAIKLFWPSVFLTLIYLLFSRIYFGEYVPHSWIAKTYFPESVSGVLSWDVLFEEHPLIKGLVIVWGLLVVYFLQKKWKSLKSQGLRSLRKDLPFFALSLFTVTSYIYVSVLKYKGAPNMPWYFVTFFGFVYATMIYIISQIELRALRLSLLIMVSVLNMLIGVSIPKAFITEWSHYTVNRLGNNDRREKIGLYLRDNHPDIAHKTVLCYEVGKIPYFSRAKVYDTLALVSREGLDGLRRNDANVTFSKVDPDFVVGPDIPSYFPMMFLSNETFSLYYKKIHQVDGYVVWQKEPYSLSNIPSNIDTILVDSDGKPKLRILGYSVEQPQIEEHTLELGVYFRVVSSLDKDYRIWLHGYVKDESILSEDRQQYGFANWDHNPGIPTSHWQEGRIYRDFYIIQANPGSYRLSLGFWQPDDGSRLYLQQSDTYGISLGWHLIQ